MRRRNALKQLIRPEPEPIFPPGHFHSPIPNLEEIRRCDARLWPKQVYTLPGIDLRAEAQVALLEHLAQLAGDLPFAATQQEGLRYWYENEFYSYGDALLLATLLRFLRPRRLIEVGSGFSSAVTLDINERYLDGQLACVFIEPFPARLHSLLTPADQERVTIRAQPVQDVPLSVFAELAAGDILLIDSSHVGKIGSDVNYLLFDVLPTLAAGVLVHFHDIFYPFEYPKGWVYQGRAWNEAYLVRAFLQFNAAFEILLFGDYLAQQHRARLAELLPLAVKNPGASLWLRKC